MSRKSVYFTSDWHIGHANVIEYSKRPFRDCEHMHRVLINNYNACVPEDGVCYFLGDMGLCQGDLIKQVVDQLNGTKILILGNHDKGLEAMYKLGFDVVLYGATIQVAKNRVTMSHCPLLGVYREDTTGMRGGAVGENWHGESRQSRARFTVPDYGQFHLHGHIHSPNRGKSKKILGKQYDVGVDANGYRPVHISRIESWIANYLNTAS